MPANFFPTGVEYFRILPEIILTLAGMLIMFLEAMLTEATDQRRIFGPFSIAGAGRCAGGVDRCIGDPGPGLPRHADRRWLRDVLPRPGDRRRPARRSSAPPSICAAKSQPAANTTR